MSGRRPDQARALQARPHERDYEVGFGKPPKETRFKPGQSGNPNGRPRGSRNRTSQPGLNEERLKAIILQEAYRGVTVNDAAGPIKIPMAQAVIRAVAVNAAKGQQRAQRLFTELLGSVERENRRLNDEWLDAAMTYKIEWDRELARRAALGIAGPEPLPHPNHVVIDMRAGTATIRGPSTREEKAQWDLWLAHKPVFEAELKALEAKLRRKDCANRKAVEREAARTRRVLDYLNAITNA
jgi:hypothetical protein